MAAEPTTAIMKFVLNLRAAGDKRPSIKASGAEVEGGRGGVIFLLYG